MPRVESSESHIKTPSSDLISRSGEIHGGYDSSGSGLLNGGGRCKIYRGAHRGKLKHFYNSRLSDRTRLKEVVPDFDPMLEFEYTQRELLLLAEKILVEDPKPITEKPVILLATHLLDRTKREIYTTAGTPEPHIVSGLYWRTHPNGRSWSNSEARKRNGNSFYR